MTTVEFIQCGEKIIIQCDDSDSMDKIINKYIQKSKRNPSKLSYLYNGNLLKRKSSFKDTANQMDKDRKTMTVAIFEEDNDEEVKAKTFMKANRVICPECYEDAKIEIKDYKIKIYGCKNEHVNHKILFKEFSETQTMDESNIICEDCKQKNKNEIAQHEMNFCNICKINLCPLCKDKHNKEHKEHKIFNYEQKNYFCGKHGESNEAFCTNCQTDLCTQCLGEHANHNVVNYDKKVMREEILKDDLNDFKIKLEKFNDTILEVINKLNKVKLNMDQFYSLNEAMINDFGKDKKNYKKFLNINEMFNKGIINEIDNIINESDFNNKLKILMNMYNQMEINNDISMIYKIRKKKDKVKIFGKDFVANNKDKCKIEYEGKEYDLQEEFNVKDIKKDRLELKLIGINNIVNMKSIFQECKDLMILPDIAQWNTFNVIDMSYAFHGCSLLKRLPNLSKWNTLNVKNMSYMFCGCSNLINFPDISKFDTSNVEDMAYMFYGCSKMESLPNISKWNTSKVKDMSYMFSGCSALKTLPDISKWDTSNVTNMKCMFEKCSALSSLPDINEWDIKNVKDKFNMFSQCDQKLNIPNKFK